MGANGWDLEKRNPVYKTEGCGTRQARVGKSAEFKGTQTEVCATEELFLEAAGVVAFAGGYVQAFAFDPDFDSVVVGAAVGACG